MWSAHAGVGSYLDDKVQEWANNYSTVYVISGVVLDANNDGQRDPDDTYSRYCADSLWNMCYSTHT